MRKIFWSWTAIVGLFAALTVYSILNNSEDTSDTDKCDTVDIQRQCNGFKDLDRCMEIKYGNCLKKSGMF